MKNGDNLIEVLNNAGYKTVTGKESVLKAISDVAEYSGSWLCSGYGVFPGGEKCPGCKDCERNKSV